MAICRPLHALVMLVDDEAEHVALAAAELKRCPYVRGVIQASSGTEAKALLEERGQSGGELPDLIFLDLHAHGGLELLEDLREFEPVFRPSAPRVMVLSRSLAEPGRMQVLEHPFVIDYVIKPLMAYDASRVLKRTRRGRPNLRLVPPAKEKKKAS